MRDTVYARYNTKDMWNTQMIKYYCSVGFTIENNMYIVLGKDRSLFSLCCPLLIHLSNTYLLSSCYVPGMMLDIGGIAVSKTRHGHCTYRAYSLPGEIVINLKKKIHTNR